MRVAGGIGWPDVHGQYMNFRRVVNTTMEENFYHWHTCSAGLWPSWWIFFFVYDVDVVVLVMYSVWI